MDQDAAMVQEKKEFLPKNIKLSGGFIIIAKITVRVGIKCLVEFCRKDCLVLPNDAEVYRADGRYICELCEKSLRDHKTYAYPTGMKHVHLGCDGIFYHL
jgi:hypothetical protein